jgi:Spherulation-specific family 4
MARASTIVSTVALVLSLGSATLRAQQMQLLVPAYFEPGANSPWKELNWAAARVPLIAIMNPNSGPGTKADSNYEAAVDDLRKAGGRVVGYVHTSYAKRPIDQVKADINAYLSWYSLDGFFIDEMTNDNQTAHLNYYKAVYDHIRSKGRGYLVVGNPGTNTQKQYLDAPTANAFVTFEADKGYPQYKPDPWVFSYRPDQFCHIVDNVADKAAMDRDMQLAIQRHAGLIYITDDHGANPYDRLPSYWRDEVAKVAELNAM